MTGRIDIEAMAGQFNKAMTNQHDYTGDHRIIEGIPYHRRIELAAAVSAAESLATIAFELQQIREALEQR